MEAVLIGADRNLVLPDNRDRVPHRDFLLAACRDFAVRHRDSVEVVHHKDWMECHTLNLGRLVVLDLGRLVVLDLDPRP